MPNDFIYDNKKNLKPKSVPYTYNYQTGLQQFTMIIV